MSNLIDAISVYSGGGGLDRGAHQTKKINVKIAIDYEKAECETLKTNFPDTEVICGKVGDYLTTLPKCKLVYGGPPCPEFSRANTGRSFDMCEVNNFWKLVELTGADYYLMENVQDVKKKLIKSNFLINAADYGVPQTRERRIFTNLPLPAPSHAEKPQQNLFGAQLSKWVSVKEALKLEDEFVLEDKKTVFGDYTNEENDAEFRKYDINKPAKTITTDARLFISKTGFHGCNQLERTRSVDEPAPTVMATEQMQITNYRIYSTKFLKEKNPAIFQKHKLNTLDRPASTILAKDRGLQGEEMIMDAKGKWARKLTNDELAILQGFPKEHVFCGKKGEIRRQIGNAVPPPVAMAFFNQV